MTHVSVVRPLTVTAPRGARWAAQAALQLQDVLLSAAAFFHAHREVRGRVEEANSLRRLADDLRGQDPRFAADLYAAADRHERT